MNVDYIIVATGLILGIITIFVSVAVVLYRRVHPGRTAFRREVVRVNLSFLISMLMVIVGIVLSIISPEGFSINRQPMQWEFPITLIIFVFIIIQGIYLATSRFSPFREEPDVEWDTLETFIRTYCTALCEDEQFNTTQIIGLDKPQKILDIYIPRELHETSPDESVLNELKHIGATDINEQSPEAFLEKREIRLERWAAATTNITDISRERKNYVILGNPGMGKTTFLKYYGLQVAKKTIEAKNFKDLLLPIYVDLNFFAISKSTEENNGKLFEAAEQRLLNFIVEADQYILNPKEMDTCITKCLELGKILFLLDGLDETLVGEKRGEADTAYKDTGKIIKSLARNRGVQIIVTSRDAIYIDDPILEKKFNRLYIPGFLSDGVRRFVETRFEHAGRAQELFAKLQQNRRLQEMSANPLLLSLLTMVYVEYADIPERRAHLYKQCVELLVSTWDKIRGKSRQYEISSEKKQQLLMEIAWYFISKGQYVFNEHDLLTIIANSPFINPGKARQALEEITTRLGLLRIVDPYSRKQADHHYEFLHLTFQEYFAAQRAANDSQNGLKELLKHIGEKRWEEIVYLYAVYTSDIPALVHELEKPVYDDIFCTSLLVSGHCVAADPVKWKELLVHVKNCLFDVLKETPYKSLRDKVAETLVEIGGPVNDQLLEILTPQHEVKVQYSIIRALSRYGEQTDAHKLKELLSNERTDAKRVIDVRLRWSISGVLGKLGDTSIVPMSDLLKWLDKDPVYPNLAENIGISIAKALGPLETNSAVTQLRMLLADKRLPMNVRQAIITMLHRFDKDKDETTRRLKLLLANNSRQEKNATVDQKSLDENEHLRACITLVLAVRGEEPMRTEAVELFVDKHIESDMGRNLVHFLLEINAYSLASDLVPLLENEQIESRIRADLALALGRLSRRSSERELITKKLIKYMSDIYIDVSVRGNIIHALGEMGESSIIKCVLKFLTDDQTKKEILEGCTDFFIKHHENIENVEEIKEILLTFWKRAGDETRLSYEKHDIAIILGILGEKSVLPDLEKFLEDKELDILKRDGLIEALSRIADYSSVERLRERHFDQISEKKIRQNILVALKQLASDRETETCRALGKYLNTPSVADEIYDVLQDISARCAFQIFFDSETKNIAVKKRHGEPDIRQIV